MGFPLFWPGKKVLISYLIYPQWEEQWGEPGVETALLLLLDLVLS